jgi:hypothetical protein
LLFAFCFLVVILRRRRRICFCHCLAFALLVVIPEGDLLLSLLPCNRRKRLGKLMFLGLRQPCSAKMVSSKHRPWRNSDQTAVSSLRANRHFDRSCPRFCEQRSGEIRFSTPPPEATHSFAFTIAEIYFSHFQPKNRMSSPKTT